MPPGQVIDYPALVGDSSDNARGQRRGREDRHPAPRRVRVARLDPGACRRSEGEATAEALLAEAEQARLSRMLVTIKTDVPVVLDIAAAEAQARSGPAPPTLTRLEFHSLVNRLSSAETVTRRKRRPRRPRERWPLHVVTSAADLAAAIRTLRAGRIMALRVEGSPARRTTPNSVG
ncbi:MAG: hypothetical protein R2882_00355 [Gemmatimonadales bacterium]